MTAVFNRDYNLNIEAGGILPVVSLSQYDDGLNSFTLRLYANNQAVVLPAGVTAVIVGKNAGGFAYALPVEISSNRTAVIVTTAAAMTAVKGMGLAEVVFTDAGGNKCGSTNISIRVEASPEDGAIEGEADYSVFYQAISAAAVAQDAADRAEDAAEAAERTVAAAVGAWLSEHVDPETGYVIDNSLTVSGAAADAKAVGDAIADIKSGGSGLTDEAKQALLNCFAHVAWIDEYGQDYYDALEDALYPPSELTRITCVYTQGGTVYDTDSLDSLKSDLVVTAHYDNDTTQTVTSYTLSGTLEVGTSTITVSYDGKTTTFDVTVTHAESGEVEMSEFIQHSNIRESGFKLYSDGGETGYSDARFPTTNGRTSVSDVFTSDANIKVTFTPTANEFQCWLFGSTNFDNSFTLSSGANGTGYWLKYITPSSNVFAYGWSSAAHEFTASVKAGTRFMIMGISSSSSSLAKFAVEVIQNGNL